MIPVNAGNEISLGLALGLFFTILLALALLVAYSRSSELPLIPIFLLALVSLVGLLVTSGSSQSPISTITHRPTSEQISSFLKDEYGISIRDENSLNGELGVDTGFEIAVDGAYQQCKFVSTGAPSSEGYPAVVACSTDASGTWRLLPKQN